MPKRIQITPSHALMKLIADAARREGLTVREFILASIELAIARGSTR